MKRIASFLIFAALPMLAQAADSPRAVLLVSIDGLRPDYVLEADKHGLKLPNLRGLAREGSFARGVRGVLPTATYPSHTAIITGAAPARHGIVANHPFAHVVKDLDVWYYYAED
ncbi:MAG TPA: alkaline phosphatase family protein, partial [Opitutaceae bacterium]|nr:alkaline phosphatase family protein [Opitutaceae bacterium]